MQHPMQAHMGANPAHNVTTELIQKYLDENKQLILAILDNQNLGKLNDCAAYQARLQANLMYLAAIADSQPQPHPVHAAQVPQAAVMQPGLHYMAHQQTQQQMAQQSLMAARNPLQYTQQSYPSLHHAQQQQHQQQAMQAQHGMNLGGTNSLGGMASESGMGGNNSLTSGGFPDFGCGGNTGNGVQGSRGLSGGGAKSDVISATEAGHGTSGGNGGNGAGHIAEESETSYLKGSEEEGN